MRISKAPSTLALIPDGNRRWARSHRLDFFNGYRRGVEKFIDFAEWCKDYGVDNITVWAFSTENFRRPGPERDALFGLYKKVAADKKMLSRLHETETRFNVVGDITMLPKDLARALKKVEVETGAYKDRVINMLVAYGGKDDILHAARLLVRNAVRRGVSNVNETLFRSYMISRTVPDIDLVIRTSGEERLSGFMPWQSGYSELYFSKKLWPDFTRRDLELALVEYERRRRRFGF
ncbi:MAG: di-trans,poly-cis-decaprenylcistransferase [Candidatus Micrarchaeota archaeon]|nr:di-trans,poly-cis-decaprenylcistransferase [Candidatus Micrarchaeota archaeon]